MNFQSKYAFLVGASLIAVGACASPEYVDSEIELRLRRMADLTVKSNEPGIPDEEREEDYHFRLLAGLRARWEDDIALGLIIQSQGLWAEHEDGDRIETGLAEAYFAARSIGFLPLSLTLGRQRLQTGRGLLLSAAENDWAFDAVAIDYNAFPLTFSIKAGRTARISPTTELEWIGLALVKYEPTSPFLRELELYGGAVESYDQQKFYPFGGRVEASLSPDLQVWAELAGEDGRRPGGAELAAWIADAGGEYSLPRNTLKPSARARMTFASGDAGDDKSDFVPMMDREIGGLVLRPALTNIQIYQLGIACKPTSQTNIYLDIYEYRRNRAEEGIVGRAGWIYEGITTPASAASRELGWELNLTLEYQARDQLTLRFTAGYFNFGPAYENVEEDGVLEGWIEMVWRY